MGVGATGVGAGAVVSTGSIVVAGVETTVAGELATSGFGTTGVATGGVEEAGGTLAGVGEGCSTLAVVRSDELNPCFDSDLAR
jgi:hypothetical protein